MFQVYIFSQSMKILDHNWFWLPVKSVYVYGSSDKKYVYEMKFISQKEKKLTQKIN